MQIAEQKENLCKTIVSLDKAASFLFPAYTYANACRAMMEIDMPKSDSGIGRIRSHDIGSNRHRQEVWKNEDICGCEYRWQLGRRNCRRNFEAAIGTLTGPLRL